MAAAARFLFWWIPRGRVRAFSPPTAASGGPMEWPDGSAMEWPGGGSESMEWPG